MHRTSKGVTVSGVAKKKMDQGVVVPVKIVKEPHNPVDSRAIAFMCCVDKAWERIGYIVKEALNDVHSALNDKKKY